MLKILTWQSLRSNKLFVLKAKRYIPYWLNPKSNLCVFAKKFCHARETSPLCSFPVDKTPITAPLSASNWLSLCGQLSQKIRFVYVLQPGSFYSSHDLEFLKNGHWICIYSFKPLIKRCKDFRVGIFAQCNPHHLPPFSVHTVEFILGLITIRLHYYYKLIKNLLQCWIILHFFAILIKISFSYATCQIVMSHLFLLTSLTYFQPAVVSDAKVALREGRPNVMICSKGR